MYKCPNCGSEFEGKFCPECGTKRQEDKACPKCGTICPSSANFCANCGFLFTQESTSAAQKTKESNSQPQIHVYVKQQKPASPLIAKIYEYLKYAPVFLFAVFAVLLFIFYATPVAVMPEMGSYGNVYILTGVSEISEIQGSMIGLIILAVLYLLAAAAAVYFFLKYKNKYFVIGRFSVGLLPLCGAISVVLYIITLIIGCVACSIISSYNFLGLIAVGAAPILIIVFSSLFLVFSACALIARFVLNKIYYNVVPDEERTAKEACKKIIARLPEVPAKNAAFNALKYLPIALFSLFSILSIAFLAASAAVMPAQEIFGIETPSESYGNVYAFAGEETELRSIMTALVVFMVISLLYSLAAIFVPKKQIKHINYFGYFTVPLYVVWLVLACVACGNISAVDNGEDMISVGAAPILIIVFSIIFALLAVGAYVTKYLLSKKDPALSSFERDLFEKNQQRKAEIKQKKQQLAKEYTEANPAPETVDKPVKRELAYFKAKRAQNSKISVFLWLIAIYSLINAIMLLLFVSSIDSNGLSPLYDPDSFSPLYQYDESLFWYLYDGSSIKEYYPTYFHYIISGIKNVYPMYQMGYGDIDLIKSYIDYILEFIRVCSGFIFIICIAALICLNRRKLKSIKKACSIKIFTFMYILLAIIFVPLWAFTPLHEYCLAYLLCGLSDSSDETYTFIAILEGILLILVPYIVTKLKVSKARVAIYGEKKIRDLNPKVSYEELNSENESYKGKKIAYINYRKAYAAYKAARTNYINEKISSETGTESNKINDTYSENNTHGEKITQTGIDNKQT